MDRNFIIFVALAVLVTGLIVYAIFYNSIANQKKTDQRRRNLSSTKQQKQQKAAKATDEKQRRKMREESLKKLNNTKQKADSATKPSLPRKLQQAGLSITPKKFYTISAIVGFVAFFIPLLVGAPLYFAPALGILFGLGFPNWVVSYIRAKRIKKFLLNFPGAVDIIVRGVRSGLPLNDCITIISKDSPEPVKSEFIKIIEASKVGMSMPEACGRLYENVPCSETNFFSIVIAIQSQAGGSLSEALGNLSQVLRERKAMADKIKAMAMEAKMSGYIVGSLPFVVSGMIMVASPGYMDPLFDTDTGNILIVISLVLLGIGSFSMWKMMNFKF